MGQLFTDTTVVAIIIPSSANSANWNRNHRSPFKIYWLFHVPPGLAFKTPTFWSQRVFTCFLRIAERRLFPVTALPDCLYNRGGVYCEVRTESLNTIQANFRLYRLMLGVFIMDSNTQCSKQEKSASSSRIGRYITQCKIKRKLR